MYQFDKRVITPRGELRDHALLRKDRALYRGDLSLFFIKFHRRKIFRARIRGMRESTRGYGLLSNAVRTSVPPRLFLLVRPASWLSSWRFDAMLRIVLADDANALVKEARSA